MSSTQLILEDPDDVRNFVPGLPLKFAAFKNSVYREGEPAIISAVSAGGTGAAVLSTTTPWTHAVAAVASGDYIFVDTGEPCPMCGR